MKCSSIRCQNGLVQPLRRVKSFSVVGKRITRGGLLRLASSLSVAPAVPPLPTPGVVAPPVVYDRAVSAGEAKGKMSWSKTFIMGILAGAYIGFGAFLAMTCGGHSPGLAASNPGVQKFFLGAVGLPFGLTMCLIAGAELFTGNTMLMTAALLEGKAKVQDLLKNWIASYAGNVVGSLLMVALVAGAGVMVGNPGPAKTAAMKSTLPVAQMFFRGLLCNWLVCLAVYQALAANDLTGKFVGLFLPVCLFVTTGLDHSVANMFILPMGKVLGGAVEMSGIVKNIAVVTLGNIVGGACFVASAYALVFGSAGRKS